MEKPQLFVFDSKKEKLEIPIEQESTETNIIDFLEDQIKELKESKKNKNSKLSKALLISVFGSDEEDLENFVLSAINLDIKEICYITDKIKFRALLNEELE